MIYEADAGGSLLFTFYTPEFEGFQFLANSFGSGLINLGIAFLAGFEKEKQKRIF